MFHSTKSIFYSIIILKGEEMKVTRKELTKIYNTLIVYSDDATGKDVYAVEKNMERLRKEYLNVLKLTPNKYLFTDFDEENEKHQESWKNINDMYDSFMDSVIDVNIHKFKSIPNVKLCESEKEVWEKYLT